MRSLVTPLLLLGLAACATDGGLEARLASAESGAKKVKEALAESTRLREAGNLNRSEAALKEAKAALAGRDMVYYTNRDALSMRVEESQNALDRARVEKKKRELAENVQSQRARVQKALEQLKADVDALGRREELSPRVVSKVRESANFANAELEDGKALEAQDKSYGAWAEGQRKALGQAAQQAGLADKLLAFAEGPGALQAEGRDAYDKAKEAKDPKQRLELLTLARTKLLGCARDGAFLMGQTAGLDREAIVIGGAKTTPKAFVKACETAAKAANATLVAAQKKGPGKKR